MSFNSSNFATHSCQKAAVYSCIHKCDVCNSDIKLITVVKAVNQKLNSLSKPDQTTVNGPYVPNTETTIFYSLAKRKNLEICTKWPERIKHIHIGATKSLICKAGLFSSKHNMWQKVMNNLKQSLLS